VWSSSLLPAALEKMTAAARDTWGNAPTRLFISVAAGVLAVVLAWCLLRASRPAGWDKIDLLVEVAPAGRTPSDQLVDSGTDAGGSPGRVG